PRERRAGRSRCSPAWAAPPPPSPGTGPPGDPPPRSLPEPLPVAFHPEGDLDVGFVLLDLTVGPQVARPVEHFHAGDVPHGLGGLPARVLHRLLPAVGGVAYQFDHLDDGHALTLHHAVSRVVCAAGGGLLRGRVPSEGGFFSHREDRLEEPAEVAPQDAPGLF